jgi:hypothetical protein
MSKLLSNISSINSCCVVENHQHRCKIENEEYDDITEENNYYIGRSNGGSSNSINGAKVSDNLTREENKSNNVIILRMNESYSATRDNTKAKARLNSISIDNNNNNNNKASSSASSASTTLNIEADALMPKDSIAKEIDSSSFAELSLHASELCLPNLDKSLANTKNKINNQNSNKNNNAFDCNNILASIDHPYTANKRSIYTSYFYTNTNTILNKLVMSYEEQLQKAISKGNYELCVELLNKNCNVNQQFNKKYPLCLAAEYNYYEIGNLKFLVIFS